MLMPSESQRQFLREAATEYYRSLEGSPAQEYLEKRGICLAVADKFALGYVAEPKVGHERFQGFLSIPYVRTSPLPNLDRTVASIRFRCIEDHEHKGHGKYMTLPGDRPRLFNTDALLKGNSRIAICEGELDPVSADAIGLPAVGVPGADAWQSYWRLPFLGYREVLVLTDGDAAGDKFGVSVCKTLPNARVVPMPAGEDVNSTIQKFGKSALLERISS